MALLLGLKIHGPRCTSWTLSGLVRRSRSTRRGSDTSSAVCSGMPSSSCRACSCSCNIACTRAPVLVRTWWWQQHMLWQRLCRESLTERCRPALLGPRPPEERIECTGTTCQPWMGQGPKISSSTHLSGHTQHQTFVGILTCSRPRWPSQGAAETDCKGKELPAGMYRYHVSAVHGGAGTCTSRRAFGHRPGPCQRQPHVHVLGGMVVLAADQTARIPSCAGQRDCHLQQPQPGARV